MFSIVRSGAVYDLRTGKSAKDSSIYYTFVEMLKLGFFNSVQLQMRKIKIYEYFSSLLQNRMIETKKM